MKVATLLNMYRGCPIYQEGTTFYTVIFGGQVYCNSAWGCICYIDEAKSP